MTSLAQKIKLLVVDDYPGIPEMIKDYFTPRNYHVFTASTARAGLEQALKECPDIILLDMDLPDFSGLELFKRIKESLPEVSIIVITGNVDLQMREQLFETGCDDVFEKGISLRDILKRVEELCIHREPK